MINIYTQKKEKRVRWDKSFCSFFSDDSRADRENVSHYIIVNICHQSVRTTPDDEIVSLSHNVKKEERENVMRKIWAMEIYDAIMFSESRKKLTCEFHFHKFTICSTINQKKSYYDLREKEFLLSRLAESHTEVLRKAKIPSLQSLAAADFLT